mmetsp:Transcript_30105/g.80537  ORF Transcript_30105/g.80537 Transcript_30105/m.80537 type:complete len:218 (-) Transcript_30105:131-784(-)
MGTAHGCCASASDDRVDQTLSDVSHLSVGDEKLPTRGAADVVAKAEASQSPKRARPPSKGGKAKDSKQKEACKLQEKGDRAFAKSEWDLAEEHYAKALELDADLSSAWAGRGGVRLRRGRPADALSDLDEALRLEPANLFAARDRAEARLKTGDLDGAISDYDAKLALAPCDGRALTGRGEARLKKGDQKGAVADLELAVKLTYPGAKELLREARGK